MELGVTISIVAKTMAIILVLIYLIYAFGFRNRKPSIMTLLTSLILAFHIIGGVFGNGFDGWWILGTTMWSITLGLNIMIQLRSHD